MRAPMLLLPIVLALAGTAHAQAEFPVNPYDPPIVPQSSDMRPMGAIFGAYIPPDADDPEPLRQRCGRAVGCVVFVNTSESFDVVSLYVNLRPADDPRGPRWDEDLLKGTRLGARRSIFVFRNGDRTMCNQQVRAVVHNRRTNERFEGVLGPVSLCDDRAHQNIMMPVRVLQGRVTIEDGE